MGAMVAQGKGGSKPRAEKTKRRETDSGPQGGGSPLAHLHELLPDRRVVGRLPHLLVLVLLPPHLRCAGGNVQCRDRHRQELRVGGRRPGKKK